MSRYNKMWAALSSAIGVIVSCVVDGNLSGNDIAAIAVALAGVATVYQVANKPPV